MHHEGLRDLLPLTGKAKADYDAIIKKWTQLQKRSMITAREFLEKALHKFAKQYKREYDRLIAKAFGQPYTKAGMLLGRAGVLA